MSLKANPTFFLWFMFLKKFFSNGFSSQIIKPDGVTSLGDYDEKEEKV